MRGGTYMAFLRLDVDLAAWRALSRAEQELAVGRDKLTGAALVAVDRRGRPVAKGGFVIDPPRRPTRGSRPAMSTAPTRAVPRRTLLPRSASSARATTSSTRPAPARRAPD